jgi:hypothetical protein
MVSTEPMEGGGARRKARSPWAKKRRRLIVILLVVAAVLLPALIWRIGVSREARMLLTAREASGQPVTMAQLNERFPAPAEEENGAELYGEALRTYRDLPPDKLDLLLWMGKRKPVPGEALDPVVRDATLEWLGANADTLEKVKAAAERKQCRYIAPYQPAGYNEFSIYGVLERLSDLACAAAVIEADRQDGVAASEALACALALARSPEQDGLYYTLVRQWEMEHQFVEALQYCLSRTEIAEPILAAVESQFGAGRRLQQIRHMVLVEQCLFLGRIREGRRRGIPRNILIATGVGDLNISAHLRPMDEILRWTDASLAERPIIEQHFDAEMKKLSKRATFSTVKVSIPPGYWSFYRKSLDQAALVRAGVAVHRYYVARGRYPDTLEALETGLSASERLLPSTGHAITYRVDRDSVELSNGGESASESGAAGGGSPAKRDSPELLRFLLIAPSTDTR